MSNYEVMGNLKKVMDYSKDGKPNWYAIINDADDKDHRAYSNQDLTSFNSQLSDPNAVVLVDVKGETAIHKSGKNAGQPYIKNAIITRMGDEAKPSVPAQTNTPLSEPTREPLSQGMTREQGMLTIGIWTRGITSGKTSDEIKTYCDAALEYFNNKEKGVDDEPYNGQF